jgi:hypothetical protein
MLLQGRTARLTDGYAAGVRPMRGAIRAFLRGDGDPDVALRLLELTAICAADLLDETAVERLTQIWIDAAQSGARGPGGRRARVPQCLRRCPIRTAIGGGDGTRGGT